MSLEAIRAVVGAEDTAAGLKSETAAACKRLLADAEARGRELLEGALKQAARQESEIHAAASADAEGQAEAVLEKADAAARKLEREAQAKIPDAVSFIVERIVSS